MDIQLRMVQAAVEAQLFGRPSHPVTVGRYTVLGPIGSGGMGSVVRAHDPELQREVALKLVRAERMGDASMRARLVQEARAMARLSHPHVAMVFEVGEADEHLYVAMELIDGRDLRAWLDEGPRPWRAALELYQQAGRGLAAAHAKGLIHRDFKPENVVVDSEGRARVVDFGLARELADIGTERDAQPPAAQAPGAPVAPLDRHEDEPSDLTTTGTLLGTPAYMSPEQWRGDPVDARSDQFSFCVAVWEALHGQRPFTGARMGELMRAVTGGELVEPGTSAVPRRIQRALRRGLAVSPDERWPHMEGLLDALRPRGRRGWWVLAGAAVAVAGTAALVMVAGETSPSDACRLERERLVDGWDDATRAAAARGVRATALPYAEDVWHALSPRLDAYADEWVEAAQTSCAGALTQTPAALERHAHQQRCLEEARERLAKLGDALAVADEATVVDAGNAADRLPDLGACADDRRLVAWATDDSPERADAVARARQQLDRAERALAVLDTADGRTRFETEVESGRAAALAAQQAAALAGHFPLQAEASLALGQLQLEAGERPDAEASLALSMEHAEASGDALTRLRARIYQVYVLGSDRDRTAEAVRLGEQALAQLDGLGPRPLLRARLLGNMATALARSRQPDHARALALHHAAIELLQQELGEHHPQLISAHLNLGRALSYAGRLEESEAELRIALGRAREVWGDDHPHTARIWGTLGLTLASLRRAPEAEDALRRSLEGRERSLGPDHQEVANALYNLGANLRGVGRHAEAIPLLRRGLEIRRRWVNADDADLIPWLFAIGDSEAATGALELARKTLREALALTETEGAAPLDFARVRDALARATAPEDPVAARLMAQAARDTYRVEGQHERAQQIEAFLATLPSATTP